LTAQVTTADIVGTITDQSGGLLPNAKVTVENLDTKDARVGVANSAGEYSFTLLPIGRYAVTVELQGFKSFRVPGITLTSGDRVRINAKMQVGQIAETIEIIGAAPVLQLDSSAVGSLVSKEAVQDLPLNGRNFVMLAQLGAGVNQGAANALSSGTRPDDRRPSATMSVGAQGSQVNNFMIDGIDNNDRAIGTAVIRPSVEALAEFRVQTGVYTAEVGRSAGGVVNLITKSGTNDLHGSLYEFFRNDAMDAAPFRFIASTPKTEFRQNQFGGSVGGPIRKNHTFYFIDYEGFRLIQGQTPTTITVPTDAMKGGDFTGVATIYDPASTRPDPANPGKFLRTPFTGNLIPANRINSIAAKYMALYPKPTGPGIAANYAGAFNRTQDASTFDARFDHHFSDRNYVYGRYSFNDTTSFIPGTMPITNGIYPGGGSFAGPALQRAQGTNLNDVHIISPTLLLELKTAYIRYANHAQSLNFGNNVSSAFGIPGANHDYVSSGLTGATFSGGFQGLGDATFLPIVQIDNTFQYSGSLTWTKGNHSIKFGASLIRRQFLIAQSNQPRGTWAFSTFQTDNTAGGGGHPIASFLLGIPNTYQLNESLTWPGMRTWEPSGYVQDDWHVNRRLTLNMGLRWDLFTPFTEVNNQISNLNMTTHQIDVAGVNGVSRSAGVQTYYKAFQPRFGFALALGSGMVLRGGAGLSDLPGQYMSQSFLKNAPFVASYNISNDQVNPTYNISQGFPAATPASVTNPSGSIIATEYKLRPTYTEQFSLNLQKQIRSSVLTVGYVGLLTRHNVILPELDQPDPGPGSNITIRRPFYSVLPNVNSIVYMTDAGTLNYHSLQATFEHRYRNGLNISSNYTWAHALQSGGPGQVESNWRLEYGSSTLDIRHRFVFTANYHLPFGKSLRGLARQFLYGWQGNVIYVFNTGLPFSVTNNTARANTGAADRPDRIASGRLDNPSLTKWFDTAAFVPQALNTAGNSGPFILYGPDQRHIDVSLFKEINLKESLHLQVRGEAYNLTNTPSFGNPNAALGNAAFGTIVSLAGSYNPRQLQFAMKLLF
jgi:hypothetical protein